MKVVPLAPNPEYAEKREKRELIGFVVTASQISDPTLEALERERAREVMVMRIIGSEGHGRTLRNVE